jgi:hypothetical protein
MRAVFFAVVLCAAPALAQSVGAPLAIPGTALAQKAMQPVLLPGDQWQFAVYWAVPSIEPSRLWIVTSVGPKGIEATENGEPLRLTHNLGVLESPRTLETNPNSLSFPLEVGKRWHYASDGLFKPKNSKSTSMVDVIVAAYEKVRVPAGELDAFRLEAKAAIKGVSGIGSVIDAEIFTTYWYAPAAKAVVKSINRNPYLGTSTVELVDFKLH